MEASMVRILPALVGAVALGAASVLRKRKRNAQKAAPSRTKAVSARKTRKAASSGKTAKNRRSPSRATRKG